MTKLRIQNRFGVVPNSLLNNENISLKAKGLFAYIQSKPDGWEFSSERIAMDHTDGRDSIRVALNELESFGYLIREKSREKGGKFSFDYALFDEPNIGNTETENPSPTETEKPTTAKPTTENPSPNKERDTKKEIEKKNILSFDDFWKTYPKKQGKHKAEISFRNLSKKELEKMFQELPNHLKFWSLKYGKETTFIPMPSTWLNGKRFEDILNFSDISKGSYNFSEAAKELSQQRERNAEKIRKEEHEMEEKAKRLIEEHKQIMLTWFKSLDEGTRQIYLKRAEDELPPAIMNSKDKFPEQFKKLKLSKLFQILHADKSNFITYPL